MEQGSLSVGPNDPLRMVLECIQNNVHGICVVLDGDKRILGTLTDGDCRRALLGGMTLDTPAKSAMHTKFIAVDESFPVDQVLLLMRTNDVRQIPVLDKERRLVSVVSERSLTRKVAPQPNSALILAGGKGTRLRPLTHYLPKPMLPVAGKPMLEHLIMQLASANITNIFLSINYMGDVIEKKFGDGASWGCKIEYLREEKELGTGGPLRLLNGRVSEPLLVLNGDLITTLDFKALLESHRREKNSVTIGVSQYETKIPFGVVHTDSTGGITAIEEKPTLRYSVNAGIYVVNPDLLPLIPANTEIPMTSFIQEVIENNKRVGAFMIHEVWDDVGMPSSYMNAQRLLDE